MYNNDVLILKQHQVFKISYFHKFYLSFEKNYISSNIYLKITKKFTTAQNIDMWDEHILDCLKRKRDICIKTIPRMFFSLSGYNILVNMESIQGNHDRREPILHKIASDSFFPNPLSPFRQGPLPLQWPEIPSRALHLLDAGPSGELLMCYVGIQ